MKKLMDFFNYVVGGLALMGLGVGITYGMYTAGGIILAAITGLLCLGLLVIVALGMSGKFREEDEKGFPSNLSMMLVFGSGLLAVLIAVGAGASSLKEDKASHSPVPVVTSSAPSEVSAPIPSAAAPSESPAVEQAPSSTPVTADDSGFPPELVALLVALGVLAILIWVAYLLKQGGDASIFGFGWWR